MKLWNDMTVCLVLFNTICTFSVFSDTNLLEPYFNEFGPAGDFVQYPMNRRPPDRQVLFSPRWRSGQESAPQIRSRPGNQQRNRNCFLTSLRVKVTDLGLGYTSEEIPVFRYCLGTCRFIETQHDIILKNLMKSGKVRNLKYLGKPCCRPSAYEDVSFYDNFLGSHAVLKNFSAKACECF